MPKDVDISAEMNSVSTAEDETPQRSYCGLGKAPSYTPQAPAAASSTIANEDEEVTNNELREALAKDVIDSIATLLNNMSIERHAEAIKAMARIYVIRRKATHPEQETSGVIFSGLFKPALDLHDQLNNNTGAMDITNMFTELNAIQERIKTKVDRQNAQMQEMLRMVQAVNRGENIHDEENDGLDGEDEDQTD